MPLTFRSQPRISQAQFTRVLVRFQSPCAPIAAQCYAIVRGHGLDPAIALAFFAHESVFGTRGVAVETLNWGNVRTAFRPERAVGAHPRGFAIFRSWQEGLHDWCERINERYINERGLDTVEKAIPVYAPSSDGNSTRRYIEHVNELVPAWIAEDDQAPPDATALRDALLDASFAAAQAQYHPEQAFHQYMLSELRAGRPLGNPLSEQQVVTASGQDYVIQVFALDTIYAPIPRWQEIGRLSALLKT
ncbi:MAG TPA: hypothetical protein VFZ66_24190 [Herpetosiphonaceae bacterium]